MRAYRTEIIGALVISLIIIGAVVFFLSHLNEKQAEGRMDLYDLILPEAEQILSINKPTQFLKVLERQPQLNTYFKSFIAEDYINLLTYARHSPVLLVFYPQGVVMYYHLYNEQDEIAACFQTETSVSVREKDILFEFYPKASNLYLGKYLYKGIGVVSYSRKLLETVAGHHRSGSATFPSSLKGLKERVDNEALLNALFQSDAVSGWEAVDLFLHEEQVCCLYNQTFADTSDSLVAVTADSLTVLIEELIPGIKVQSGLSKDDSTVYYTFCTSLSSDTVSSE